MGRWQALIDAVIAALQAETPGADYKSTRLQHHIEGRIVRLDDRDPTNIGDQSRVRSCHATSKVDGVLVSRSIAARDPFARNGHASVLGRGPLGF